MPKTPIDYSKSCIYKIVCKDLEVKELFVLSTTQFRKRKSVHKAACNDAENRYHNLPMYTKINAHGGWNNWNMLLIQYYPCKDNLELVAHERYLYEQLYKHSKLLPNKVGKSKKLQYDCAICQGTYTYANKAAHMQTDKHQKIAQTLLII